MGGGGGSLAFDNRLSPESALVAFARANTPRSAQRNAELVSQQARSAPALRRRARNPR